MIIYKKRNNALYGERLAIDLNDMFDGVATSLVNEHKNSGDYKAFSQDVIRYFGIKTTIDGSTVILSEGLTFKVSL